MDDEKLLKKLEDSVQDIEIPKSLEPEEIKKRLEAELKKNMYTEQETITNRNADEQSKKARCARDKVIHFRKYGGWAAAAAVFLVILLIAGPALKKQGTAARNSSADVSVRATSQEPSSEDEVSGKSILHVNDYGELLAMVRQRKSVQSCDEDMVYDGGILEKRRSAAYENAVAAEDSTGFRPDASASAVIEPVSSDLTADTGDASDGDTDYSSTNIQEKNVDEADIVKTDGTYIYAMDSKGNIRIVEAGTMKQTGEISAPGSAGGETVEMYVDGDVLQVIWTGYDFVTTQDEVELSGTQSSITRIYHTVSIQRTNVTTYDISDRSNPIKSGSYKQDGAYLTSRKNGEYLYIFTSYMPQATDTVQTKEYYYYVPRSGTQYLPCDSIYLPGKDRGGTYDGRSTLVTAAVKNTEPSVPSDRIAIVSGAETFYVSEGNIYVANSVWDNDSQNTDIVRFGYKDGKFSPGNYGRVPGSLNNNFSMDEYQGNLRVVTTDDEPETANWDGEEISVESTISNGLYVLDRKLNIIGKIDRLAKGERIESARFLGDTGYFVTYRNMDPLFSVDLSDPENPKILGELKITGFSEYLHFYGKDKLLGLGWETDPNTGETKGLKCSMFDLSDPENVKESEKLIITDVAYCDVMDNYKSILIDPEKNIFGFSYAIRDGNWQAEYCYGVFSYSSAGGFQVLACIQVPEELAEDYDDYQTLRGLYIGKTLYVASRLGIQAYDMEEDFAIKASLTW